MTTPAATPDGPRNPLSRTRKALRTRLSKADRSALVQKVVSTHLDQSRITAAKFSSFI
jgi:hypothetical protein